MEAPASGFRKRVVLLAASFGGFIVSAGGGVTLLVLVAPSKITGANLTGNVAWTVVLAILAWASVFFYIIGPAAVTAKASRVAPAAATLLVCYAVASYLFLIAGLWFSSEPITRRVLAIIQVLLGAGVALALLGLPVAIAHSNSKDERK
jgi:hypothetical protein